MARDYFDERIASLYDATSADQFEPAVLEPAVDFLAALAAGGAALELGIGTGRIALPLSQRGVRVAGIDLSPAMVAQLRAKPGADAIEVTVGDFATTRVPGTFKLAYLVYNTISNLTTQDEQVRCFQNVADHLEPGGYFVIELFVPALQRLPVGETVRAFQVKPGHLGFDEYDIATQRLVSHHYLVADGKLETFSVPFRYAWPSELDLMARLAGLTLRERWASWTREPFTHHSTAHISVWQKPSATGSLSETAPSPLFFASDGTPLRSLEDWRALLPAKHWRDGRSAKLLAQRWIEAGGFPSEVRSALSRSERLGGLALKRAVAEHVCAVPGLGGSSVTDLMVNALDVRGNAVIVAVEGTVDEGFGPSVRDWLSQGDGVDSARNRQLRLRELALALGLDLDGDGLQSLRYQLLHRAYAGWKTARDEGARTAVLLIHSFVTVSHPRSGWRDFAAFARLLTPTASLEPGQPWSAPSVEGVELWLVWVGLPTEPRGAT